MRDSTYKSYSDLFEEMANRHPGVAFFHEIDENEIIVGEFRSKIKFPAFILEYPPFGFNDNRTNVNQVYPASFAILKQLTKSQINDKAAIKQYLIDTNIIMLDMISFLREKRQTDGNFYLDTSQIKIDKVGPIFDMCYGWRCEFTYQSWVDLNFDADAWEDFNPDKFK